METTDMTILTKPQEWGLHHTEWRPSQFDAVQWVMNNEGHLILSAETGSGKSAVAKAVSSRKRVVALCKTKNLQEVNYGQTYGFDVLFGKGNYPCIHPEYKGPGVTASECAFAEMQKCPYSGDCPYLIAKNEAMFSDAASLNYAYYLSTKWAKQIPIDALILDEAHQLSDITLEWAGLHISERARREWDLPDFPEISGAESGIFIRVEKPIDQVRKWLGNSVTQMNKNLTELQRASQSNDKARVTARQCENMIFKLQATLEALSANENEWYIRSGYSAGYNNGSGRSEPALVCKPLTARYHFRRYFDHAETVLMMSATIGAPDAFAEELGIGDNFAFRAIPSQWPPETRPVYDLGAPSMGRKATPADFERQAMLIAKAIKECPPEWSGVIHVTRKTESTLLAERLARHGLGHRIWIPRHDAPTNQQMKDWEKVKRQNLRWGMIAISWFWMEGADLTEERICISAKSPFPSLADPYETARLRFSGKTYLWRTATTLEQSLGRTRRGEKSDYDHDGIREQFVAICDGSYRRVQSYLSRSLRDAIVKI